MFNDLGIVIIGGILVSAAMIGVQLWLVSRKSKLPKDKASDVLVFTKRAS